MVLIIKVNYTVLRLEKWPLFHWWFDGIVDWAFFMCRASICCFQTPLKLCLPLKRSTTQCCCRKATPPSKAWPTLKPIVFVHLSSGWLYIHTYLHVFNSAPLYHYQQNIAFWTHYICKYPRIPSIAHGEIYFVQIVRFFFHVQYILCYVSNF